MRGTEASVGGGRPVAVAERRLLVTLKRLLERVARQRVDAATRGRRGRRVDRRTAIVVAEDRYHDASRNGQRTQAHTCTRRFHQSLKLPA